MFEISQHSRTKEKLNSRIADSKHQIADLQIDAAIGAEEMIV